MIQSRRLPEGKMVEIFANNSTYKGILLGASEDEVYLKTSNRTWVIPLNRVQSIKELGTEKKTSFPK